MRQDGDPVLLAETERLLRKHSPVDFDSTIDAAPESIEFVRAVEDEEAWRVGYDSLEAFYAAHEAQHPDIRVYGAVRREMETEDILTSPGGTISKRIARHREQQR
jgi:hypothetical protein